MFVCLSKIYLNLASLNQKWLTAVHCQELGEDFYREEAEAKLGNDLIDYTLSGKMLFLFTVFEALLSTGNWTRS